MGGVFYTYEYMLFGLIGLFGLIAAWFGFKDWWQGRWSPARREEEIKRDIEES